MRISNLGKINVLAGERAKLASLRAAIAMDMAQVLVRGTYLDDAMAALVRPVLMREVDARMHRVAAEMRDLGVELDADPVD